MELDDGLEVVLGVDKLVLDNKCFVPNPMQIKDQRLAWGWPYDTAFGTFYCIESGILGLLCIKPWYCRPTSQSWGRWWGMTPPWCARCNSLGPRHGLPVCTRTCRCYPPQAAISDLLAPSWPCWSYASWGIQTPVPCYSYVVLLKVLEKESIFSFSSYIEVFPYPTGNSLYHQATPTEDATIAFLLDKVCHLFCILINYMLLIFYRQHLIITL